MTARQSAIEDIKSELHQSSKAFIAFNKKLNPVIKQITEDYINTQQSLNTK